MACLSLSTLFEDNAVFPKNLPIRVWGTSSEAGSVTLSFPNGEERHADFVPRDGKFSVTLAPFDAYAEGGALTVRAGEDSHTAKNIAIGIVILAGGQSNMELMLRDVVRPYPLYSTERLRFYTEKHAINEQQEIIDKPMSDKWYTADGDKEMQFSAIGYFVAEHLSRELDVTVGVVSCNQGAARIDSWLSPMAQKKSGVPLPPRTQVDKGRYFNIDNWLYYNKYVHIAEYSYDFVLWYQGESNTGFDEGMYYGDYLHALIEEWRENNPNHALPFYLIELASFDSVLAGWAPEPLGAWAPVREALVRASLTEKNVYTVSLTENDNVAEIHPVNKYPLADKLFRAILTKAYGYNYEYTGPVLDTVKREGDVLTLTFTHAKGLGFRAVAGDATPRDIYFTNSDGSRTPALPTIVADTLSVNVPMGATAFALGYHNVPAHNLYNAEGYLASPFKVDLV